MAKRKKKITCTAEFTEGAEERITQGFVDMYFLIKAGVYPCKILEEKMKRDTKKKEGTA